MSNDPKWQRDLDAFRGRRSHEQMIDSAWLAYLVGQMPKESRVGIVKAIRGGKTPRDYFEELARGPRTT